MMPNNRVAKIFLPRSAGAEEGPAAVSDPCGIALNEVLREVPYNSATEFHRWYNKEDPDPRHGAACIHQTLIVAERAAALGAPQAKILQDMRHIAAVFEINGDIVVLDPYLLHETPIRFPSEEVWQGFSSTEVAAAPVRFDERGERRPARLSATYRSTDDGYRIRLSYSRYSVKKRDYVLSRHFTLRSESLFALDEFTNDMVSLLTHPEQNSVSLRALIGRRSDTAEAILPLKGFAERVFSAEDLWLRSGIGVVEPNDDRSHALAVWDDIERSTGLDRGAVEEHLVLAAQIYQRIADPGTQLQDYKLGDE